MTRFRHPLRWAAAGALAAAAALAQFAVIDVGAIAKAVEQIQTMTQQLEQISAFRQQMDAQVTAVTRPFTDLVALHDELTGTAFTLPPALGTAPAIGQRLEDRLAPIPGNAGYLQPPTPTAPQLQAALTPVAPDDPLVPDPVDARRRALLVHDPQQQRQTTATATAHAQNIAEAQAVSTGVNVLTAAGTALGAAEAAASEDSWTAIMTRQTATLHTLATLQAKALELEVAARERELLRRQSALADAGANRVALLQAAADGKAFHAALVTDPDRDAGDTLLAECGGRMFTNNCGDVDPAYEPTP